MLEVSNKTYQIAKKNGFDGSFAQFAEICNQKNSEMMNKTDLEKYFNDGGLLPQAQSYTLLSDYTARIRSIMSGGQIFKSEAFFKKGQVIKGESFDGGKTISTQKDGAAPNVNIMGGPFSYPIPMNLLKAGANSAAKAIGVGRYNPVNWKSIFSPAIVAKEPAVTGGLKGISFGKVFFIGSVLTVITIVAWYYYKKYKASGKG